MTLLNSVTPTRTSVRDLFPCWGMGWSGGIFCWGWACLPACLPGRKKDLLSKRWHLKDDREDPGRIKKRAIPASFERGRGEGRSSQHLPPAFLGPVSPVLLLLLYCTVIDRAIIV